MNANHVLQTAFNQAACNDDLLRGISHNLGADIIEALKDDDVIEIMLNPDGRLWIEKFGRPMTLISTVSPEQADLAIAQVESGLRPWVLNVEGRSFRFDSKAEALAKALQAREAGRSFDVGIMQINNWWLDRYDITLEAALDPLANIYLGCWILKNEISRHSTLRQAIGAYHSPNPAKADRYATQVLAALNGGPKPTTKTGTKKLKVPADRPKPARRSGQTALEPSNPSAPMTVYSGRPKAAVSNGRPAGVADNSLKVSFPNGKK